MAQTTARTQQPHTIEVAPSTANSRGAAPASSSDSPGAASHPRSRKGEAGGGGHGNSGK